MVYLTPAQLAARLATRYDAVVCVSAPPHFRDLDPHRMEAPVEEGLRAFLQEYARDPEGTIGGVRVEAAPHLLTAAERGVPARERPYFELAWLRFVGSLGLQETPIALRVAGRVAGRA